MTLNEWEQSNIEVLTSREMGEWLSRRENRLLDKIRAEIKYIGGDDEKAFCKNLNKSYIQGLKDALKVIDKYREEQE